MREATSASSNSAIRSRRTALWRRGAFAFVLTLVAILVFMASFAVGYARVNEGKVLPGVDVAGVSLSGLTRDQAAAIEREGALEHVNGPARLSEPGPDGRTAGFGLLEHAMVGDGVSPATAVADVLVGLDAHHRARGVLDGRAAGQRDVTANAEQRALVDERRRVQRRLARHQD